MILYFFFVESLQNLFTLKFDFCGLSFFSSFLLLKGGPIPLSNSKSKKVMKSVIDSKFTKVWFCFNFQNSQRKKNYLLIQSSQIGLTSSNSNHIIFFKAIYFFLEFRNLNF